MVPAAGEDASSAPRRWRLAVRRSVTRSGPGRSSSALRSATLYEPRQRFDVKQNPTSGSEVEIMFSHSGAKRGVARNLFGV